MKTIFFTVTNDLVYDQRMQRICATLANEGYRVVLVGRKLRESPELKAENFSQRRISCFFTRGSLFYAEFNLRLFFFLAVKKIDAVCAIDLDTILPVYFISVLKRIPRIYDAHELFTELKEVITRPSIKRIWTRIERFCVPKFKLGYTVSGSIAEEFNKRYGVQYDTIRNMPYLKTPGSRGKKDVVLYQGAVNEARGLEQLIPAMKHVPYRLVICGDGNFMKQLKELIKEHRLEDRVELMGRLNPQELWETAQQAKIGVAVPESLGLNQYLALPNKFFDYVHEGLPQVTVNYPEYAALNREFEVAILLDEPEPEKIAAAINLLMTDQGRYTTMRDNCLRAREAWNWEREKERLVNFYRRVFTKPPPAS